MACSVERILRAKDPYIPSSGSFRVLFTKSTAWATSWSLHTSICSTFIRSDFMFLSSLAPSPFSSCSAEQKGVPLRWTKNCNAAWGQACSHGQEIEATDIAHTGVNLVHKYEQTSVPSSCSLQHHFQNCISDPLPWSTTKPTLLLAPHTMGFISLTGWNTVPARENHGWFSIASVSGLYR